MVVQQSMMAQKESTHGDAVVKKITHNYTINNCASQSSKKSINAQVKKKQTL